MTIKTQEALEKAREVAAEHKNQEIGGLHMLLALLGQTDGVAVSLLRKIGVEPTLVAQDIERALEKLPRVEGLQAGEYLSKALNAVLEDAWKEAQRLQDEYLSTEHLLVALAATKHDPAGEILVDRGVSGDALHRALDEIRGSQRVTDQNPEEKYQALEKFARDLTEAARAGKLDPVIGRDDEIRRVMQVLSRRTKNNQIGRASCRERV